MTKPEPKIVSDDGFWMIVDQDPDLGDPYIVNVDKSGRCFRIGQVDVNIPGDDERRRPRDELHICNIDVFIEFLQDARRLVAERWGEDDYA